GMQTWVALPDESEDGDAFFESAAADEIPVDTHGDVVIRMLVGTAWGVTSPIPGSSPLVYADLTFPASGGEIPVDGSHPEVAVCPIDQDVYVDGFRVAAGTMAVLT